MMQWEMLTARSKKLKGMKVLAMDVPDVDMNGLRNLGDQMKEKIGDGVVVLASANGGKVTLLAMATDAAIKKGAHAGKSDQGDCILSWWRRWRSTKHGSGGR